MSIDVAAKTPVRMSIANLSLGESLEAQFNPTKLEEALEVNWARQTVSGLSHQPLQFVNTGNVKFTLELQFEAQDPAADIDRLPAGAAIPPEPVVPTPRRGRRRPGARCSCGRRS